MSFLSFLCRKYQKMLVLLLVLFSVAFTYFVLREEGFWQSPDTFSEVMMWDLKAQSIKKRPGICLNQTMFQFEPKSPIKIDWSTSSERGYLKLYIRNPEGRVKDFKLPVHRGHYYMVPNQFREAFKPGKYLYALVKEGGHCKVFAGRFTVLEKNIDTSTPWEQAFEALEASKPKNECGNGIVESYHSACENPRTCKVPGFIEEQCDDGNNYDLDGCSQACIRESEICTDTDMSREYPNGKNPYKKSTISGPGGGGGVFSGREHCIDEHTVMEYECLNGGTSVHNINCPKGCKDGACLGAPQAGLCGNGRFDSGEECDPKSNYHYVTDGCNDRCLYNHGSKAVLAHYLTSPDSGAEVSPGDLINYDFNIDNRSFEGQQLEFYFNTNLELRAIENNDRIATNLITLPGKPIHLIIDLKGREEDDGHHFFQFKFKVPDGVTSNLVMDMTAFVDGQGVTLSPNSEMSLKGKLESKGMFNYPLKDNDSETIISPVSGETLSLRPASVQPSFQALSEGLTHAYTFVVEADYPTKFWEVGMDIFLEGVKHGEETPPNSLQPSKHFEIRALSGNQSIDSSFGLPRMSVVKVTDQQVILRASFDPQHQLLPNQPKYYGLFVKDLEETSPASHKIKTILKFGEFSPTGENFEIDKTPKIVEGP